MKCCENGPRFFLNEVNQNSFFVANKLHFSSNDIDSSDERWQDALYFRSTDRTAGIDRIGAHDLSGAVGAGGHVSAV